LKFEFYSKVESPMVDLLCSAEQCKDVKILIAGVNHLKYIIVSDAMRSRQAMILSKIKIEKEKCI